MFYIYESTKQQDNVCGPEGCILNIIYIVDHAVYCTAQHLIICATKLKCLSPLLFFQCFYGIFNQ